MSSALEAFLLALLFLIGSTLIIILGLTLLFRRVNKSIQDELDKYQGNQAKQDEIRKKVVKAVFPPRFDR